MSAVQYQVFVSYSQDQLDFAENLAGILSSRGFSVWFAPDSISLGERWSEAISQAVANSQILVLVWSADAARSRFVETEYTLAINHNKIIIPIIRDGTDLPPGIITYQAIFMPNTEDSDPAKFFHRIGMIAASIQKLTTVPPSLPPSNEKLDNSLYRSFLVNEEEPKTTPTISRKYEESSVFLKVPSGPFYPGTVTDRERYGGEYSGYDAFDIPYEYEIAKYPVLVSEYCLFLENAKGYSQRSYWSEAGWSWCKGNGIDQPSNWSLQNDPKYGRYPVFGINFYEVVAYSRWYTEYQNDHFIYRLPTETEWEKAARGGKDLALGHPNPFPRRIYPWGDDPNTTFANTSESGRNHVVSVDDHLEQASSPYGVVDMAGNLCEWCINVPENYPGTFIDSTEGSIVRVQRGGHFQMTMKDVRCGCRILQPSRERHLTSIRLVRVRKEG